MDINKALEEIRIRDPKKYEKLYSEYKDYLYPPMIKNIIIFYISIIIILLFITILVAHLNPYQAIIDSFLGGVLVIVIIFGIPILSLTYSIWHFFKEDRTK